MKRVLIIANPKAGSNKKDKLIDQIFHFFAEQTDHYYSIEILFPATAEETMTAAKTASQEKTDLILPIGGDGTINLVCSGVFEGGSYSRIGIIPSGTVNNFARSLGIPLETKKTLQVLIEGQEKAIDIAQVNDRYMISSLTLGLMADMALKVTSYEKRRLRALAFLKAGWKIWLRQRSYHLSLTYDGIKRKRKTKILLLTMTNQVAGQKGFTPEEKASDGIFSVYSLDKLHLLRFMWFYFFRKGNFNDYRHWEHFRTSELLIQSQKRLFAKNPVTRIDGDTASSLPVHIQVHKKAITVLLPAKH